MVRRRSFFELGGFDISLQNGQVADFVERARRNGHPVAFRPDLRLQPVPGSADAGNSYDSLARPAGAEKAVTRLSA